MASRQARHTLNVPLSLIAREKSIVSDKEQKKKKKVKTEAEIGKQHRDQAQVAPSAARRIIGWFVQ